MDAQGCTRITGGKPRRLDHRRITDTVIFEASVEIVMGGDRHGFLHHSRLLPGATKLRPKPERIKRTFSSWT